MSGSYYTEFLNQNFRMISQDQMRKSFFNAEQADSYFKNREEIVTGSYNAASVILHDLLSNIDPSMISITSFNPYSDSIRIIKLSDIGLIKTSAYPININLKFLNINNTNVNIELTLVKPVSEKSLQWLYIKLKDALKQGYINFLNNSEHIEISYAKPWVFKSNDNFAVYVGTSSLMDEDHFQIVLPQLEEQLKKLFQPLVVKFSDREELTKLGDIGNLQSLEQVTKKIGYENIETSFSPYGPMLNGDQDTGRLIQFSVRKGALQVILMISPEKDWSTASLILTQWVEDLLTNSHDKIFNKEQAYFLIETEQNLMQLEYLSEIEDVHSERYLRSLERWALLPYTPSEMKQLKNEAMSLLVEINSEIRYTVALKILTKPVVDEYTIQRMAATALSNYPESYEGLNVLLKIWENEDLEWNLRYFTRDLLIEMSEKIGEQHPLFETLGKLN